MDELRDGGHQGGDRRHEGDEGEGEDNVANRLGWGRILAGEEDALATTSSNGQPTATGTQQQPAS